MILFLKWYGSFITLKYFCHKLFQILNDTADIGEQHITITNYKELPVTFGPSNFAQEFNIIAPLPTYKKPILNTVIPFSLEIYLSIMATYIVGIVAVLILFKIHNIKDPMWYIVTTTIAHGDFHLRSTFYPSLSEQYFRI